MSRNIFASRNLAWLGFFAGLLVAWAVAYAMSVELPRSTAFGAAYLIDLCRAGATGGNYLSLLVMWALMSAAMMAPTFVPTLSTYTDLSHAEVEGGTSMGALVLGYLLVWLGFSVFAAGAQYGLLALDLVAPDGSSLSWTLTAALFALAGGYQFSTFKEACLSQCRAPLTYFMGHWQGGAQGALRMGLHLGLVCLGCCWALMLLGFVGGTMNLAWMGLATLVMVVEKLPQLGQYVTYSLGVLLLSGAVWAGLTAIFG